MAALKRKPTRRRLKVVCKYPNCRNEAAPGRRMCEPHLAAARERNRRYRQRHDMRAYQRRRRQRQRENGKCAQCNQPVWRGGLCRLHYDDSLLRARRNYTRNKGANTMTTKKNEVTPAEIGSSIGRAIARDVLAEDMPKDWTGIDPQDGDRLTAAGIEPDSPEWDAAVEAARQEYLSALAKAKGETR